MVTENTSNSSQLSVLKDKLEVSERGRLRSLECTIAEGMHSFVAVGKALQEIRDSRLYRESYKTFDKYVDEKWNMGRNYANKLIASADVNKALGTIVPKNERVAEFNTERHLREIKSVPAESLASVVDRTFEIAGDKPATASDIKQAREEILEQVESELVYEDVDDAEEATPLLKKPKETRKDSNPEGRSSYKMEATTNWQYAQMAILQLQRIQNDEHGWDECLCKVEHFLVSYRAKLGGAK